MEEVKALLDRVNLDYEDLAEPLKHATATPADVSFVGLNQLIEIWISDNHPPAQHIDAYRYAAKRFIELHTDLDARQITKMHVRTFREKLALLPTSTRADIRAMTIHEAIETADTEGLNRLSVLTIKKHLMAISTLLNQAVKDGHVEENVASGITVAKRAVSKVEKRKSFTPDQLKKTLLSSP